MKNFYLLYPLMFGKSFEKSKDVKISDYRLYYDEKQKKYFWIFVANYLMLPADKDILFQIPFVCESAKSLMFDAKSGRGNFIKCITQEDLNCYKQIKPAKIDVVNVTEADHVVAIDALGEKSDILEHAGMQLVFVKFETIFLSILKQEDKQKELYNDHLLFL